MPTIQSIRNRWDLGESIAEIVKHEGVSKPTARKYLQQKDFSPELPIKKTESSILDPYEDIIEGYLEEDVKNAHPTMPRSPLSPSKVQNHAKSPTRYGQGIVEARPRAREGKRRK